MTMSEERLQTRHLLVDGAKALVAGHREQARELLLKYIENNEHDGEGWLWISGAMDDVADIQVALENSLNCNPNNQRALQGLNWLNDKVNL